MKAIGYVLLVVGVIMLLVRGINFKTKEKVVDLGPVEINKTENHNVNWPLYAGGVLAVAGAIMVFAGAKKTS